VPVQSPLRSQHGQGDAAAGRVAGGAAAVDQPTVEEDPALRIQGQSGRLGRWGRRRCPSLTQGIDSIVVPTLRPAEISHATSQQRSRNAKQQMKEDAKTQPTKT